MGGRLPVESAKMRGALPKRGSSLMSLARPPNRRGADGAAGKGDVPKIRFANRSMELPASRAGRIAIGVGLVAGGTLGFLPILGFWMLPLGFLVLSYDIRSVRRARRRLGVAVKRWWSGARRRTDSSSS